MVPAMTRVSANSFKNFYLASLAEAFLKRRKAISHRLERPLELESGEDRRDGLCFEFLALTLELLRSSPKLSLHFKVWEDSTAWINLRSHQKKVGLLIELEQHAELWSIEAVEVVARVERSMVLLARHSDLSTETGAAQLKQLWSPAPKA